MAKAKVNDFVRIDTPRNVTKVLPIVKVGANEVVVCIILSVRVWGYATHWNGSRTVRCTGQRPKCELCNNPAFSTRDKGLVLIANTQGQMRGFLELTPLAWKQVEGMASSVISGLRGKVIQVRRENSNKKGRLLVEYVTEYSGDIALPADRDPEPTLRRIHGLPDSETT